MFDLRGTTLALDASTYGGSAAVLGGWQVVAERTVAMRGEREERLLPAIVGVLSDAGAQPGDVACVACSEGPGSFTSLRIAASIAKGLAVARAIPLVTAPSLCLAVGALDPLPDGGVLATLDAMRGEVHAQQVRVTDGRVAPDGPVVLVATDEAQAWAARDGLALVGACGRQVAPHARGFARLSPAALRVVDVAAWEPTYGRLAEAQVKWEQQHRRALPVDGR